MVYVCESFSCEKKHVPIDLPFLQRDRLDATSSIGTIRQGPTWQHRLLQDRPHGTHIMNGMFAITGLKEGRQIIRHASAFAEQLLSIRHTPRTLPRTQVTAFPTRIITRIHGMFTVRPRILRGTHTVLSHDGRIHGTIHERRSLHGGTLVTTRSAILTRQGTFRHGHVLIAPDQIRQSRRYCATTRPQLIGRKFTRKSRKSLRTRTTGMARSTTTTRARPPIHTKHSPTPTLGRRGQMTVTTGHGRRGGRAVAGKHAVARGAAGTPKIAGLRVSTGSTGKGARGASKLGRAFAPFRIVGSGKQGDGGWWW